MRAPCCDRRAASTSAGDQFGLSLIVPVFAIACGISVRNFGRYRPQNCIGWAIIMVGFGVLSLLDEHSSRAHYIGTQVPLGVGLGIVWISTQFPILAPLSVSNHAHALTFFTFVRCFAQVSFFVAVDFSNAHLLLRAGVSSLAAPSFRTSFIYPCLRHFSTTFLRARRSYTQSFPLSRDCRSR